MVMKKPASNISPATHTATVKSSVSVDEIIKTIKKTVTPATATYRMNRKNADFLFID
ncbi:hypothetical protein [uncultured Bacteroides sp.]|uniref:hypothetical protein n=1 Tax=uncultured Bacteroides sp. TaxID=162156 RepID=UPI00321F7863